MQHAGAAQVYTQPPQHLMCHQHTHRQILPPNSVHSYQELTVFWDITSLLGDANIRVEILAFENFVKVVGNIKNKTSIESMQKPRRTSGEPDGPRVSSASIPLMILGKSLHPCEPEGVNSIASKGTI